MTTMIERVALVLSGKSHVSSGNMSKARKIVEAIREPTQAMLSAGQAGNHDYYPASVAWTSMIDAALAEKSE